MVQTLTLSWHVNKINISGNTCIKLIMARCVLELTAIQNLHFFLPNIDLMHYSLQNTPNQKHFDTCVVMGVGFIHLSRYEKCLNRSSSTVGLARWPFICSRQFVRKSPHMAVEGPSTRHIFFLIISASYPQRTSKAFNGFCSQGDEIIWAFGPS